jgi:acetyl-CoA carboxylase / biotin carboxylase 1
MVVALKELSIRGEFRTTVEYLIKLLETPAFEDNTITTGWLDNLISNKLTAERPDPILAVVCGAVTKAHAESESCLMEYRHALEKGQIPSRDILKTVFPVDFIYEGERFRFTATRSGPDAYHLFINGSKCAVGVRDLSDGGLLVLLNGGSHTVYYRDEVGSTRLSVDSKTCLLEQENDPTQLRSPSPGKLAKFLVESGEHVKAGQAFAEVEVMKMYMPLIAQEDGIVQLIKQPGSQLEAGEILGILSLDDPSKVKHAKPYEGQLPPMGLPVIIGDKPTQRYTRLLSILNNIFDGYDNQVIMVATLKELQEVLRDAQLPFGEWESAFAALSSRMPPSLDAKLSAIVHRAQHRSTDFPARQILKAFDDFFHDTETIRPSDAEALKVQLEQLPSIAQAYKNGLQAHEYGIFEDLLTKYWNIESLFSGQNIRDEDVILRLRDENKDDMSKVVQTVLSHARVGSKNNLVLALLGYIKPSAQNTTVGKAFAPILKHLSELDSRATSKVALKAREVLIQTALPSLEERQTQMEMILKSAVVETTYGEVGLRHREPDQSKLKDLIDSRFNVFDVLPSFFTHPDDWVKLAALEVYVRRSYRAYSVLGVDYHEESDAPTFLTWKFQLRALTTPGLGFGASTPSVNGSSTPTNEKLFAFKRVASVSDMSFVISKAETEPVRTGAIVPVTSFSDFEEDLHHVLEAFPRRPRSRAGSSGSQKKKTNGLIPTLTRARQQSHSISLSGANEESTNVLNIVVIDPSPFEEKVFLERVQEVIAEFVDEFDKRGIRRVTFTTSRKEDNYPRYYTFRGPTYLEDPTIRHIEPALAFQLELSRLSNFNFSPVFTDNRNIHVYKAEGKDVTSDVRFFVRAVVRPPRLRDEIPTSEYLISETDRLVNDILDALQILGPERTDMNHIFINFTPTFELFPEEVEQALGGFIERFGRRVWRLRITGVEVRIICKDPVTELLFPLRVIISNVSGFVIKIDTYAEVKNDKGEWIFKSFGPATGAMHLRPITSPYPTKEWLQPKRYKAHIMGTTYVYDFPELFSQAVRQQWQAVRAQHPKIKAPEDILDAKELIFDEHGQLIEVEREPGTNSTGMVAWLVTAKTPEYPKGRRFVVIANDITHQIGSFGPAEDRYFFKVTELARTLGIPRIYLSANSGARIGLANELIPLFSVAWKDPSQQAKGFDYLYLTENVHQQLEEAGRGEVITERMVENGEVRHKITTIIGAQDGLGVECLRGSGLIAGATSRAYEDIFTITLVTCRSVGMHLIYSSNDRYRCLSRKTWPTRYPNRRTANCIILIRFADD